MSSSSKERVALCWFRKGLRLHDNEPLVRANNLPGVTAVYPVFILDPWFTKPERVGTNRMRFLLQSLQDLDDSLRQRGSRLFVPQGKPLEVLPSLCQEWGITDVFFEKDTEPYALRRDENVKSFCTKASVTVHSCNGHTLFDMDQLLDFCGGKENIPTNYGSFMKVVSSFGAPHVAREIPKLIPPANGSDKDGNRIVPVLSSLGYQPPRREPLVQGGETAGLHLLKDKLKNEAWVNGFEKPKTSPTALEPATTSLSPYLKFGCVSPRKFYWDLKEVYSRSRKHTEPPVSLLGQLYWREFFYLQGYGIPGFDKMTENRLCRQINWDDNPELLKAWEEARTGYPWIDAAMTQLNDQGWLHHLARHAVACFLTRGDLYQHWEKGAEVFERLLIDADWSINNGNWLWLSASAYFYQYFRVYNPATFARKTDPNGDYIRKWVPALKHMPSKYIFEPWKAPISVQREADCMIGKDYPKRIVIHEDVSKANIERHKKAYAVYTGNSVKRSSQSTLNSIATKKKKK
eukprot:gb/GECG01016688.1/.p1 GENE.gb/GECG01016688.1/~~gb/GECG01016688.1/.p1  ORF type:complete len:518 (+),score=49.21 gb/GECG01016688.1/:1-1554(+)